MTKGRCKYCDDDTREYRIETKGKRKGEKFIKSKYFRVFEEVNWFREDDEYLGTYCKNCLKFKPWTT